MSMRVQIAEMGKLLSRGLYKLPVIGPNGEYVLCAVMSDRRLTPSGVRMVPFGAPLMATVDALEAELERCDPMTDAKRRQQFRVG